jgi:hypothetical protein
MNQNIVDSDTGLTGILELAIHTLHGSVVEICCLIHDLGAFPSELKDARRHQIFGSSLGHKLPLCCRSRKAYHIELGVGESDADVGASLHHPVAAFVQVLLDQGLNYVSAILPKLRRLDDGAIACSDGHHQRFDRHKVGEVPTS